MVVVDEVDLHAMEAVNKRKTKGIVVMPTTVADPLEAGGVKATPGSGKQRPRWTARTVAKGS
mgnify:CR=1 FL=1